jgi:ankyrin repeat protein
MRVLKILQHKGWNVNVFDLDGRTPLHLAACSNNLEVTRFLVENGADVMYKDLRLNNALADAIREKFPVIIQYTVEMDGIIYPCRP